MFFYPNNGKRGGFMTEEERIELLSSKIKKLNKAGKFYIDTLIAKLAKIHTTKPPYKKYDTLDPLEKKH
jgi:hypothetical protein